MKVRLTNRQPIFVSSSLAVLAEAALDFPITKGARVIDSTPPARTRFAADEQTARAACATASSPDAHNLFTVVPGQETGIPASNADIRATLRLSSPAWFAQPRMTSSMDERSSAAFRSISARRGIAARSSARMCASAPLYRPIGVRTARTEEHTSEQKSEIQSLMR